jgi:hypothetical protein
MGYEFTNRQERRAAEARVRRRGGQTLGVRSHVLGEWVVPVLPVDLLVLLDDGVIGRRRVGSQEALLNRIGVRGVDGPRPRAGHGVRALDRPLLLLGRHRRGRRLDRGGLEKVPSVWLFAN